MNTRSVSDSEDPAVLSKAAQAISELAKAAFRGPGGHYPNGAAIRAAGALRTFREGHTVTYPASRPAALLHKPKPKV